MGPFRRASALVAVPVYIARVRVYVPSAPVHVSLFESATVVATKVGDVVWTELGPPPWANAMPARTRTESAAEMAASGLRCIVGSLVGFAFGIGSCSRFQRPRSRELRPLRIHLRAQAR